LEEVILQQAFLLLRRPHNLDLEEVLDLPERTPARSLCRLFDVL